MSKAARRFNLFFLTLAFTAAIPFSCLFAESDAASLSKNRTSLTRDIVDQSLYYEGTQLLRLDRLYRFLFQKKKRAKNINVFDEVPDSAFFTNRHGRKRLSEADLVKGSQIGNQGPDLSGDLTITRGKFQGLNPGFFVKDVQEEEYMLEFDSADSMELTTSAEVIAGRFFYAIGYNVAPSYIVTFEPQKLIPGKNVKMMDGSGFSKPLTAEKLEEFLIFVPTTDDGLIRASANKIIANAHGKMTFQGRCRNDPHDPFYHEDRREIRALTVFGAWLNNVDIRQDNTLDAWEEVNGQKVLKHYILDHDSALGSAVHGYKPPHFTHEYFVDYGETLKAILALGLWEKPWQKRWEEAGEKVETPALGYFDNRYFDPAKFKTQLPYYAFKDLTRADGFWAAKIIMGFTDSDIAAIVKTGEFSNPEVAEKLTHLLIERRNIIGNYWFNRSNPLDLFDVENGKLIFEDLAVTYGFQKQEQTTYHVEVIAKGEGENKKITSMTVREPSVSLESSWGNDMDLLIRTSREGSPQISPYVKIELRNKKIAGILHED